MEGFMGHVVFERREVLDVSEADIGADRCRRDTGAHVARRRGDEADGFLGLSHAAAGPVPYR